MNKGIGVAVATAAIGLGTWAVTAAPANASSIEHQDPTVHSMNIKRATKNNARPTSSPLLSYHGGTVATGTSHVFVVYWGAQWGTATQTDATHVALASDPSNLAPYQQAFLAGLGGSESWSTSTTQYCQGVKSGTLNCGTSGVHVAHSTTSVLTGVWADNGVLAPSQPSQSQLAQEAVNAVAYFRSHGYTFTNATDQVVVTTAHGNNASGFGTQYCAWHSSTSSTTQGTVAYTNMPYIPDAGGSCGANFVNSSTKTSPNTLNPSGALDGVSIVGGHEYAETITDMYPNGGWLDSSGSENCDKCAWKTPGTSGGTNNVTLGDGNSYPMQSLWSNTLTSSGGCAINYVLDSSGNVVSQNG